MLLVVYRPRYDGMAPALRRAAAAAGWAIAPLNTYSVMSQAQRDNISFSRTRLVAFARSDAELAAFMSASGLRAADASEEADWSEPADTPTGLLEALAGAGY